MLKFAEASAVWEKYPIVRPCWIESLRVRLVLRARLDEGIKLAAGGIYRKLWDDQSHTPQGTADQADDDDDDDDEDDE